MLKTLLPRTRARLSSPINGEIKVVEYYNGPCVWVDGIQQSGPYIKKYWQKVFEEVSPKDFRSVLILGFGAGSAYTVLRELNSSVKVTGVEIDPAMLSIAQTYFGVKENNNTQLFLSDAGSFLKSHKNKFDAILVDLYQGAEDKANKTILSLCRLRLKKGGFMLVNSYDDQDSIGSLLPKSFKKHNEVFFKKNRLLVLN